MYQSRTNVTSLIFNQDDQGLSSSNILLGQSFDFYAINKSFKLPDGSYERLDLLVYDVNGNKIYESDSDYVLAGHCVKTGTRVRWSGTVFAMRFTDKKVMPKKGDVYKVMFNRPLSDMDSILYMVNPAKELVASEINNGMEGGKFVGHKSWWLV